MPSPGSVTNVFFNNYGASGEQRLMEDLIIETISIHGLDFYYIPRTYRKLDELYLQDPISTYDKAIQVCMYVRNFEGFEGDGTFMSKFQIEVRDRMTFTIAQRVFLNEIGDPYGYLRPNEGDLVYYPLNNKVFQIKYVEDKPVHYPLGILPTWDVFCELFEYSNEEFNTGITEVDRIQQLLTTDVLDYAILTSEGTPIADEAGTVIVTNEYDFDVIVPLEDNTEIDTEADSIIDFSVRDPFAEDSWNP